MRTVIVAGILILIFPGVVAAKTFSTPKQWSAHITSHVLRQVVTPEGYTPQQIRQAYAIPGDGAGTSIAIVDAYSAPKIQADLAVFDRQYGLPVLRECTGSVHPCLSVINQAGSRTNSGWATETSLDVEWAHAIAPKADITLVSAATDSLPNLLKAIDSAMATHPSTVSLSWGGKEFPTEGSEMAHFSSTTTKFIAAAGDNGSEVLFPAVLPTVLSVGGTTLQLRADGSIQNERAWAGSGGGESAYLPQPPYQQGFSASKREVPDVAYNADPVTGYSVYASSEHGWAVVGGTSAGAPQWAAILAGSKISASNIHAALYTAAHSFHDIISGTNGKCGSFCTARPNYDTVTGLGTPDMRKLANILY